jgi:hypothetical protein
VMSPIPVTALSKAGICGRSLAGNESPNRVGGMDIRLIWVLCVVRQRSLRRVTRPGVPAQCDVSECDREASTIRRPWTTSGCRGTGTTEWCLKYYVNTGSKNATGHLMQYMRFPQMSFGNLCLKWYDAVSLREGFPALRRSVVTPSSRVVVCLNHEDGGTMFLWNVRNRSSKHQNEPQETWNQLPNL